MKYTLLYTDRENQQRESGPFRSPDDAVSHFRAADGQKGEVYNARSIAMYHAGIRKHPPVVIERLWKDEET